MEGRDHRPNRQGVRPRLPAACPPAKRKGENKARWKKRLTQKQKREFAAWRKAHRWHPHQPCPAKPWRRRGPQTYVTRVRKEFGLEAAQIPLGHTKANVTQIYAEREMDRAAKVAARMG